MGGKKKNLGDHRGNVSESAWVSVDEENNEISAWGGAKARSACYAMSANPTMRLLTSIRAGLLFSGSSEVVPRKYGTPRLPSSMLVT